MVRHRISKSHTRMRSPIPDSPIPAEKRLVVSIRSPVSGKAYDSLMRPYRIDKTTISKIVPKGYQAIYKVLKEKYFNVTNREEKFEQIIANTHER